MRAKRAKPAEGDGAEVAGLAFVCLGDHLFDDDAGERPAGQGKHGQGEHLRGHPEREVAPSGAEEDGGGEAERR